MSRMTKPARIQLWLDRLNRHSASQLTVAEFCEREEVSLPSFYQWKRRLSPRIESATKRRKRRRPRRSRCQPSLSQPSLSQPAMADPPGFTELVLKSSQATASVSLPGEITISLGVQPEIASLIIDRLLQHVANLAVNTESSC
jgi:hypothetical protein